MLAEMLTDYGCLADNNSVNYDYYDVNLVMGLWYVPTPVPSNTVVFCMGSDVWRDHIHIPKVKLALMPSEKMRSASLLQVEYVPSEIWCMPVNTKLFNQKITKITKRDTLFYAPDPETYCLNRIFSEVAENPCKIYTLLGGAFQNFLMEYPPNLLSIRNVPYHIMPEMYLRHKNFKVWLSHSGACGPSIMNYEAYLMGLKSYFNDEEVTMVPKENQMEVAIPRLHQILKNLKQRHSHLTV